MKNLKHWTTPTTASALLITALASTPRTGPSGAASTAMARPAPFAVPAVWPTNLTQKWSVNVGKGDSSPALAGMNLYVFARQEADEALFCLDAATGNAKWKSAYPADYL